MMMEVRGETRGRCSKLGENSSWEKQYIVNKLSEYIVDVGLHFQTFIL